jgi:hypothetical protein
VLTGDDPDYSATGLFELSPAGTAGLVGDAAPKTTVRVWGIAAVAAVLLAVAEFTLVGDLVSVAEENAEWLVHLPSAQGVDVVGRADEVVGAGSGFWVTFAGLVLVAGVNATLLVRPRPSPLPDDDPDGRQPGVAGVG